MDKAYYDTYRHRLEHEGRIALWALMAVGLIGVVFAVIHGFRTGFTQGETWFTVIFGLSVTIDVIFLSPIYRYLAAVLVRRRQRLRGDPVDEPEGATVRWGESKDLEQVFKGKPGEKGDD